MTTVTIEIDKIDSAITAMKDLADAIDLQRSAAQTASRVHLPTLSSSGVAKSSVWMRDHLEDLTLRRDLAILLDKEGTGSANYTVASDTLRNVQDLLGTELANAVDDLGDVPDEDAVERLSGLLSNWQHDPEVMAAMYEELGPDGTVGAVSRINYALWMNVMPRETLDTLAEQLRTGLSTASDAPGFPAETFAKDIVRYSTYRLDPDELEAFQDKYDQLAGGPHVLTYLMQDTTYSDDFLLGAARELDAFEQTDNGFQSATDWYRMASHARMLDIGDVPDDPMAAIMHNFGANPEAGLTFFTEEPSRQTFYFNDRTWEDDGYAGISHAVEGIGTHEANLENNAEATTGLVSRFLDQVADSEGFNPDDAKPASPHVANLLKFYMPAVDNALLYGDPEGAGTSVSLDVEHLGTFDHYPLIFRNDLDSLMQVAMSTQDGTERIAEGVASYQQTRVNNLSAELALDPDNINLRNELQSVLVDRSTLQAFAEYTVGRVEIDGAASRDAQRQAFLDAVSGATSLVPLPGADAVGDVGSRVIKYGFSESVRLGKGEIADSWTNEAASVADDATTRAEESLRQVKLDTFYSLVESGVISGDDVPDRWLDSRGNLIDQADIPEGELPSYTQSAMNAVNDYVGDSALTGAYKDQFTQYYAEAPE